jgi:hypothetical protein
MVRWTRRNIGIILVLELPEGLENKLKLKQEAYSGVGNAARLEQHDALHKLDGRKPDAIAGGGGPDEFDNAGFAC